MKNKYLLFMLLGILLIGNVMALDTLGVGKQNQNFTIIQTCSDATYITLDGVVYPDKTYQEINTNMTSFASGTFVYNFTETSQLGRYDVFGTSDGCDGTFAYYFEVTYSGMELSTGTSIFYAVLIFLMILLFVGTLYGTGKLPEMNEKDDEGRIMSVKWLKYLRAPLYFVSWMLFIAIFYISSSLSFAYLGEQLFAKVLFTVFQICFRITPIIVIVWVVWFFVSLFQDKKFQELLNRGLYPQTKRL